MEVELTEEICGGNDARTIRKYSVRSIHAKTVCCTLIGTKRKKGTEKMKIKEKYRILGEAIMREYFMHGEKEIVVTITDASILEYTHVSVDTHPIVHFTKREMEQIKGVKK